MIGGFLVFGRQDPKKLELSSRPRGYLSVWPIRIDLRSCHYLDCLIPEHQAELVAVAWTLLGEPEAL